MKITTVVLAALATLLAACGKTEVPYVEDPHKIVIDGKAYSREAFLKEFCQDRMDNSNCAKVNRALPLVGPMPAGY